MMPVHVWVVVWLIAAKLHSHHPGHFRPYPLLRRISLYELTVEKCQQASRPNSIPQLLAEQTLRNSGYTPASGKWVRGTALRVCGGGSVA
eukprot:scaffold129328_cov36-Phaeocystis_antarctica.AAC.1